MKSLYDTRLRGFTFSIALLTSVGCSVSAVADDGSTVVDSTTDAVSTRGPLLPARPASPVPLITPGQSFAQDLTPNMQGAAYRFRLDNHQSFEILASAFVASSSLPPNVRSVEAVNLSLYGPFPRDGWSTGALALLSDTYKGNNIAGPTARIRFGNPIAGDYVVVLRYAGSDFGSQRRRANISTNFVTDTPTPNRPSSGTAGCGIVSSQSGLGVPAPFFPCPEPMPVPPCGPACTGGG